MSPGIAASAAAPSAATILHDALTSGLSVLRIVLGAMLLSIIVYRLYLHRPRTDVPVTAEEISAYKRTGRHPGAGLNTYPIRYGGGRGWPVVLLVALAAAALLASAWEQHGPGQWHGVWHGLGHALIRAPRPGRHGRILRPLGSLACALAGLYCAALAGLLLHDGRAGRHARIVRLLAAMDVPATARVLTVESLPALLGVHAGRRVQHGSVAVLVPDAATRDAATINLRRAGIADRTLVATVLPDYGAYDAVLLQQGRPAAAALALLAPGGTAGLYGFGRLPGTPAWLSLPPTRLERLLGWLSLGTLRPYGLMARP